MQYTPPGDHADAMQTTSALQFEKIRFLYAGAPAAIITNILLALILAGAQSTVVAPSRIYGWLATFGAILLARLAVVVAWRRSGADAGNCPSCWIRLFRTTAVATGMGWGLGAVLLFPPGDLPHQVLLSFVLAGMSAGAITLLAVDRISMRGFVASALLPLMVRFGFEGGETSLAMGAMVALFLSIVAANASQTGRTIYQNFRLRIKAEEHEQVLQESEARYRAVTYSANDAIITADSAGNVVNWNRGAEIIFGYGEAEIRGQPLTVLMPHRYRDRHLAGIQRVLSGGEKHIIEHAAVEFEGLRKDGSEFPLEISLAKWERSDGQFFTAIIRDISRRKKSEMALKDSEARFRFMLENSPIAARITNLATGRVVFANQRYAALNDLPPNKVIGIDPKQYYANPQDYADVIERLSKGERVTNRLVELFIHNGHERTKWVLASYLRLEYQNEPAVLGWLYDITDRKEMEEKVQHLAYHDPLTDLPNRMLFTDRLQQALATAKRDGAQLALMFIDLDRFKPVNDAHGHDIGDLLLKEVAQRVRDCLRESDTVARIGGDEFVVLLPEIRSERDALEVAEKIRGSLNQPFELAGHSLGISSCTGIAIYPKHGDEERLLMKNADAAMYYAKFAGRDNVEIYRPGMQEISG